MRRTFYLALVLFLYAPLPSSAQVDADSAYGFRGFEGNEETIGSKVDDPPKLRVTAPITEHGGGGGVLSFNLHRFLGGVAMGGQQVEMAMLRVEQAEDVRGQVGNPKAEFNFLCNDGSGTDDPAMRKCLSFTYSGITQISPGIAASIRAIASGASFGGGDRMTSVDGRFVTIQQGDGNFVTYDQALAPIGDPSGAVWSAWTGKIDHPAPQSTMRRVAGFLLPGM